MVKVAHYMKSSGNGQDELQGFAKNIFAHGEIEEVVHHSAASFTPGGERTDRYTGTMAIVVKHEGFPIKYTVHMTPGFRVFEIIEEVGP
jgi:hypothetical protein